MKNRKLSTSLIFLSILTINLFCSSVALAFRDAAHQYIAQQAIALFQNTYDVNDEISGTYYQTLISWSKLADYNINYPGIGWVAEADAPRSHFWDADSNTGLVLFDTAYQTAQDYWDRAKSKYSENNKYEAYELVGAVIHLLSDMGSPAHVHNDDHFLGDYIESYLEQNHLWQADGNSIPSYSSLHDYMYNLNQRTAWFPSNGLSGLGADGNDVDENGNHHSEWHIGPHYTQSDLFLDSTNEVKQTIGSTVVPLSIQHVTGMLKLFWDEFHVNIFAPSAVSVLKTFTCSGSGRINGAEPTLWEWDFDYDGSSFHADSSGKSVPAPFYKQTGNKTIALRVNGSSGQIITKSIVVESYPIYVDYPDHLDPRRIKFSTDSSTEIKEYRWDFGEGKPVETGREHDYTYDANGLYTVTLSIVLQDDSILTTTTSVYAGLGKIYVPGHTIYSTETWHTGNTYEVGGNISVANGASLIIENGATVKLAGGVQISVSGTLKATGATFTWADGANQWGGIWFQGASSGSRLENCTFEHAAGLTMQGASAIIDIVEGSSPTITGCTHTNCPASPTTPPTTLPSVP
jgi:hypothetical protein